MVIVYAYTALGATEPYLFIPIRAITDIYPPNADIGNVEEVSRGKLCLQEIGDISQNKSK